MTLDAQQPISQTQKWLRRRESRPITHPQPNPYPRLPVALEPTNALAAALDYLRGIYLVKLPASGSFNSVEVNQDIAPNVAIIATYGKVPGRCRSATSKSKKTVRHGL